MDCKANNQQTLVLQDFLEYPMLVCKLHTQILSITHPAYAKIIQCVLKFKHDVLYLVPL